MRIAILMVALLAGCATTPRDVREGKAVDTFSVAGKPLGKLALCVTRGFDEKLQSINTLRMDDTSGTAEMIGSSPPAGTVFVVDFKTVEGGVEINSYVSWQILAQQTARKRIREIVNECS